jgi:UDP-2-acetamido-3-amino-2,3-dideoxy-glucuronate N-acetyltransferase
MNNQIAVIGAGYWGKNLVRNFFELGALHTVCDANLDLAKALAGKYPDSQATDDYESVLSDKDISGVVISTPAALHYRMALQAINAGKDVFVEKPLALRVDEARELAALSAGKKRVMLVGHLLEYHPAVLKLKELVDAGSLGKTQYIYSNRLNLGKFRTEENILWSFAPHDIAVMLLMLGGEMPLEVSVNGGYYLHDDIADVTLTALTFRNGVRGHIFVSWLNPYKDQRLVVVGDRKMAVFNDTLSQGKLQVYAHQIEWVDHKPIPVAAPPEIMDISQDEPLKNECADFLHCIETRQSPRVDGRKGAQVVEILARCQESLEHHGQAVTFSAKGYWCHPSAIIDQPVNIGDGSKIWHFSHVMPDVNIGRNCNIGQNVYVARGVKIGHNVKIQNNVSLFEGVTLEDDVFCGPSCVFTNVNFPRSHVSRKNEYQTTIVHRGASIGANATIVCGHSVGAYAFVGAGSTVTRDIPDNALVYGNPARVHGFVCECGEKLIFIDNRAQCHRCRSQWEKAGPGIKKISWSKER